MGIERVHIQTSGTLVNVLGVGAGKLKLPDGSEMRVLAVSLEYLAPDGSFCEIVTFDRHHAEYLAARLTEMIALVYGENN